MKVIVFRLAYTDGEIELPLSYPHRAYLCFLADRGGSDRLDWEKLTPEQIAHMRQLIDPFRCISEHPSIGDRTSIVIHQLTDAGRVIVEQIRKSGGP